MKLHVRLLLTILPVLGLGIYLLARSVLGDVRQQYLESMEETMVDASTVLACIVSERLEHGATVDEAMRHAMIAVHNRTLNVRIYGKAKSAVNLHVLATDAAGVVVFDSYDEVVGQDFSRWNDVLRTLRGEYGARSTRKDPDDPDTSTLYVATPILDGDQIIGVLSVGKPAGSVRQFIDVARRNTIRASQWAALAVAGMLILLTLWVTRPIRRLIEYAEQLRQGRRASRPDLGAGEMARLGDAFQGLHDELAGRHYAERYIQTLTHEMKSPLAAIRGAAELLQEDMPAADRARFIGNIQRESERLSRLADSLLRLSIVEGKTALEDSTAVALDVLCAAIANSASTSEAAVRVRTDLAPVVVTGDEALLRQAIGNLVQNAVEFSPVAGEVSLTLRNENAAAVLRVQDQGPGIPEYALSRVCERFYSLARPNSAKSTGLGLSIVSEVAQLHSGDFTLVNGEQVGAVATLRLPIAPIASS